MRGRIRTVKPEALHDEELWDLEVDLGAPVFRAFVGLWTQADREGRFEWRPRALKAAVLPYWDGDFSRVLDALVTRDFLRKYAVDGREYGWIPTFRRHQAINNKEAPSEIPPPPESIEETRTCTRDARVTHAIGSPLESTRVEGNGREGNGREGVGHALARVASPNLTDPGAVHRHVVVGFKTRYGAVRAGAEPPKSRSMDEAYSAVVLWLIGTASSRKVPALELADRLLDAFFASPKAAGCGFKLSWLAQDPLEFLEPPAPIESSPRERRAAAVAAAEDTETRAIAIRNLRAQLQTAEMGAEFGDTDEERAAHLREVERLQRELEQLTTRAA